MATIEVNGKELEVDEQGHLCNFNDWEPGVADVMSNQDGFRLTSEHWEIINLLREYYEEYQIAPSVRLLIKAVAKSLVPEKGNSMYLFGLFPNGPDKQSCRYAGLPKPPGSI